MRSLSVLSMFSSSCLPVIVWTINANPKPFKEMQPDGTYVELRLSGNEDNHQLIDNEGYTVIKSITTDWIMYAIEKDQSRSSSNNGDLEASTLIAGRDNPASFGLKKGIKKIITTSKEKNSFGVRRNLKRKRLPRKKKNIPSNPGGFNNLVIMLKFSNHINRKLPTNDQINTLFNSLKKDPAIIPTGSVRNYFLKNSYRSVDLVSSIYPIWIILPKPEEYYSNNGKFSEALHYALDEIEKNNDFSLSDLDLNRDGEVDMITLLHSGYGAEWGATDCYGQHYENRIWSHKSSIAWQSKSGKITVNDYNTSPALWGTCGSDIGRIGVITHEIGHSFGLPDLYDTTSAGNGIGSYDVMSNCWGFDGSQLYPPMLSAWSKIKMGWLTPKVIRKSGYYNVPSTFVYKIQQGFPSGEYLLIENRQPLDYDDKIPQGGLAIWHIDENISSMESGYPGQKTNLIWPYNGKHYRVALLQADGLYDLEKGINYGNGGDLWHGKKTYIGPSLMYGPYPNTDSYKNGIIKKTGITISEISSSKNIMRFKIVI